MASENRINNGYLRFVLLIKDWLMGSIYLWSVSMSEMVWHVLRACIGSDIDVAIVKNIDDSILPFAVVVIDKDGKGIYYRYFERYREADEYRTELLEKFKRGKGIG